MGFIAWIVVGAIAGFLASQDHGCPREGADDDRPRPRRRPRGRIRRPGVLKMGTVNGITVESVVIATLGAIAVIFVVHLVTGSRGVLSRR